MPDLPPPFTGPIRLDFKGPVCKGSISLGTACGLCERCKWEERWKQIMAEAEPAKVHVLPVSEPAKQPDLLVGPFEYWRVVVDGRFIPLLTGFREGDKVWLVADGRFGCGPFSTEEDARQAAILAAQCMAVTAGYPHMGAEDKSQPFAPQAAQWAPDPNPAA